MKNLLFIFILFSLVSFSSLAKDDYSFGVGWGTLYSGLGVNVALRSKTDFKYIAAGCLSYGSESKATCGAGIGWITTTIFDQNSTNHGLGFYLGAVDTEFEVTDRKAVYGTGISYHYFFNGIVNSGTNIGLSLNYGHGKHKQGTQLSLEIGYQF